MGRIMAESNAPRTHQLVIAIVTSALAVGVLVFAFNPNDVDGTWTSADFEQGQENRRQPRGWGSDFKDTMSNPRVDDAPRATVLPRSGSKKDKAEAADFAEAAWRAQRHDSRFTRFESIGKLGDWRHARSESVLIDLLSDADPAIRETVVEALSRLRSPRAAEGLGYALNDTDPLVRQTAVELLAELGTRDALNSLAAALSDPAAGVRLAAVYELADNQSPAASALLQRFLSDTDPRVSELAAEYLDRRSEP
jgi:HEAT repeat protein